MKTDDGKITARPKAPSLSDEARVLIVTDVGAESLSRELVDRRYAPTVVDDGAQAIDALVRNRFDLLFLDAELPGMGMADLVSVVRAYDIQVAIISFSSRPPPKEPGTLEYLRKPVSSTALDALIARIKTKRAMPHPRTEFVSEPPSSGTLRVANFERALQQLWIAFQPIVSDQGRTVFGYEALMRSHEPTMRSPLEILDAAERLERLPELGQRVRGLAATAFFGAPDSTTLFVKLHSRDLLDPGLYDNTSPLAAMADRVVLELTERATLEHVGEVRPRLSVLRFQGFRVAIDDLGTGYAGLTSFDSVEPEFVKLDMSLIRNIHLSPVRSRLVESMLDVCRDLKIRVVAEGIETKEELDALSKLGCELFQGYLFARPATAFA